MSHIIAIIIITKLPQKEGEHLDVSSFTLANENMSIF